MFVFTRVLGTELRSSCLQTGLSFVSTFNSYMGLIPGFSSKDKG